MRDEHENLDYTDILSELRGDDGLLLWMAVRNVALWGETEPEKRGELFDARGAARISEWLAQARLDPRVELGLTSLNILLTAPAEAAPDLISSTCIDLSRWAEERQMLGTAIAFAQAAAVADPENPTPAARVGILAAKSATRSARAETWLRRAIGLARRRRDWQRYAGAYIALADLYIELSQLGAAKRFLTKATRAARRHGLLMIRGEALHRMVRIKMTEGELAEARQLSKAALRAYGGSHPAIPDLLLDAAYLMTLTGAHLRALALLRRLLEGVEQPARRARILAVMARAAAGAIRDAETAHPEGPKTGPLPAQQERAAIAVGVRVRRDTYAQAWSDAWMILTASPAAVRADPATVLDLVRAAATLHDAPRIEQATRLARTVLPAHSGHAALIASLDDLAKEVIGTAGDL